MPLLRFVSLTLAFWGLDVPRTRLLVALYPLLKSEWDKVLKNADAICGKAKTSGIVRGGPLFEESQNKASKAAQLGARRGADA